MLCIINNNTDPYFNIASEEHLLKSFDDDVFMLYRNEPSVIIGKHQNAFAEVNYLFVKNNKIPVVRRLSGGGAVFHDLGNINFTFICNGKEGHLVDFKKFIAPILSALQEMGVPAEANTRNDMVINGLKISGNAEHVFKNRTLHHGTLLYSAKLDDLKDSLKVLPAQFSDRAVRSVRSSVTNIKGYMSEILSVEDFMATIQQSLMKTFTNTNTYAFNSADSNQIHHLIGTKYKTWQWNFGYSPKCRIYKSGNINSTLLQCELVVEKGIITNVKISPDKDCMLGVKKSLLNSEFDNVIISNKLAFLETHELNAWINLLFA